MTAHQERPEVATFDYHEVTDEPQTSGLQRLGAMLPDEALRIETRQFTTLNLNLLFITFLLALLYIGLAQAHRLPLWLGFLAQILERGFWFLILLVLLPLAMTMALIWKTKEVILDNVFSAEP